MQYVDEVENRIKRISTKEKVKSEALKFLTDFKTNRAKKEKLEFISFEKFKKIYLEYANSAYSIGYIKRGIENAFNSISKEIDGSIALQNINSRQLEKILISNYQKSKYGTLCIYRTLKSIFQKAVQWKYLNENPIKSIKLPKVTKSYPVYIKPEELQIIISNEKNQDFKELYLLALYTGMRLGEILNLKWNCIDFDSKEITIKNTNDFTTKSKLERIIPINKTLFQVLFERKEKKDTDINDYLFSKSTRVKLYPSTVSKNFKRAVIKSELNSKIHFHTLRHSFASNLVTNGVSLYIVKELLGHQDYSTTQIYSHLSNSSLEEAVNKL